jgi:amino-acid N-acetyltransferase
VGSSTSDPVDAAGTTGSDDPVRVRRARTQDVDQIRRLIDAYAPGRILLAKDLVTLYEDITDFRVAIETDPDTGGDRIVGCGAVHVLWADIAEVRTLAVDPRRHRRGIGSRLLAALIATATDLGVSRVCCLTFEVDFFRRHGFQPIPGPPVTPAVFAEMVRSHDEGVAEFLDLERVRPNTLGNTRMLLELTDPT